MGSRIKYAKYGTGSVTRAIKRAENREKRRSNNQCPKCGRKITIKEFINCEVCRANARRSQKNRLKRLNIKIGRAI